VIRDAALADLGTLRDLYRRSSLSNEGDEAALLAHPEALVWPDLALREGRTRVAVRDDELVGFAGTLQVGDAFELVDLFVAPEWMQRGIGRDLILDMVAIARDLGVERVGVTANPHAHEFYEKVGFVCDGDAETQFGPGTRMHLDVSI
jgi:GNAT superfamily N-acetyltransferase